MKRKLLFIIATVFLVAACHNDDYMPGLPAPGNEDNETEMAEQPHHTWAAAGIQDQFVRFHNSHSDLFVCLSLQPHAVGHGPEV